MPASRSAPVEPSNTHLVTKALIAADDFMTQASISDATKLRRVYVRQTLYWLRKISAVDALEVDGVLYWFATPHLDKRSKHIDERKKEDEQRTFKGRHGAAKRQAQVVPILAVLPKRPYQEDHEADRDERRYAEPLLG